MQMSLILIMLPLLKEYLTGALALEIFAPASQLGFPVLKLVSDSRDAPSSFSVDMARCFFAIAASIFVDEGKLRCNGAQHRFYLANETMLLLLAWPVSRQRSAGVISAPTLWWGNF